MMTSPTIDLKRPLVSQMADSLQGNQVLKIAYQVRDLEAQGHRIANYTIGDFDPKQFPIPAELKALIIQKLEEGHTTYPLSMGMLEFRKAIAGFYSHYLKLDYSPNEVLVGSGTRPLMFATFMTIVDPGEIVVYGAPSWNSDHYCHIVRANERAVQTSAESGFLLTADDLKDDIAKAVLVVLNSPANPSGAVYKPETLQLVCERILNENRRRERDGLKPVYAMYDHIYWTLSYGHDHVHPVGVAPEMRDYTIYVDGVSKSFAGTGLRVGWGTAPEWLIQKMSNVVAHMGAWAPKPEQLACAEYLTMFDAQENYLSAMRAEILRRMNQVFDALTKLKADGFAVDVLPPQGGLLMSVRFDLLGRKTADGKPIDAPEVLREFLLMEGGWALVPFAAFGDDHHPDWFRLSVSGLSAADVDWSIGQIRAALNKIR